jgi:hypothetical protein
VNTAIDRALEEIRDHAGILLSKDRGNPTAAIILGLVPIATRALLAEREESFSRISALRLALRQIADLADASEPISVQASQWAQAALAADGGVCGHPFLTYQDTPSGETERATCTWCGKSWLEEIAQ